MVKKSFLIIFVILFSHFFTSIAGAEINIKTPAWQMVKDLGKKGSYTFLFLGDAKTDEGKNMLKNLNDTKQELIEKKADIVKIIPDDPKEQDLLSFFKIKDYPTVLVVAPNGAITGYFSKTADKKVLGESLVSLKEAEIFKNLQEGRVVFLCFHKDTEPNIDAIKSDLDTVANNFKGAVNVIYTNSDVKEEKSLTKKLQVSSALPTVFIIVPPGRAVAKLEGSDITKENLMRALVSSCGGGGCGSGCK